MTRTASQFTLILLALSSVCVAQASEYPEDPVAAARELAARVVSAKSSTGRFSAAGSDRIAVYDFIRWVEDLAERYQSVTGLTLPDSRVPLIRVFFTEDMQASAGISSALRVENEVMTHSLTVVNYESGSVEELMASISGSLTATVMYAMRDSRSCDPGIWVMPSWLPDGIAQNLYAGQRKRNSGRMLSLWKEGRMMSLSDVTGDGQIEADPESARMARGLFAGWLLSFGKDAAMIRRVCAAVLKDGKADSSDVIGLLAAEGVSDPDEGWDIWLKRQDRMVYLPGGTAIKDLAWLKAQLLLYPADFGIRLSADLPEKLVCEDLIALKDVKGIRDVLASRFVEMQLRGAGNGDEFRGIVDAYCRFFDGVIKEKADWRLKGYLEEAEKKLRDFEIRTLGARLKAKGELESERDIDEKDE
jgi:hypothetical protein